MQQKLIRLPKVIELTGLPKSSIYKNMSDKTFPQRVLIGKRTVAWLESEVKEWQESMIMQSRN